jgi:DNA-binding IclR family transcriptional regulator
LKNYSSANNRSVERAISVLILICQSRKPIGLTEISRSTGLDKATTRRLLNTLISADLVRLEQGAGTRRYMQGAGIYNFWPSEIRKICRPYLQLLLEQTQETVCLIVPRGMKRACIDVLEPDRELRIVAPIGRELPIYLGASGRIFMAYKPQEQVDIILSNLDPQMYANNGAVDREDYLRQVAIAKKIGYAINVGKVMADTAAIATAIFDGMGNAAAAVVLRAPASRINAINIEEVAGLVKAAAKSISNEMANIHL